MWGLHCVGTAFPAMEMVLMSTAASACLGRLSLEKESLPDGWKKQNQNH